MMRARRKIALVSLSIVVAIVVAFFLLDRAPVTVAFVRYERTGTDWYAYMEIHNNSSRPISYHSAGITGTHYVWESPQIQHEGLRVTDVAILPARSNAMFRVLMMTTDHDWRVGIDYDIPLPGWSLRLPMGILDRASRLGIIDSGTHRAWSPQIKKPGPDQSPNEATAPNAAMTLPFQIEHDWRGIGESRRSTNVLTAGMDWPPKGAECGKKDSAAQESADFNSSRWPGSFCASCAFSRLSGLPGVALSCTPIVEPDAPGNAG